MTTPDTFAKTSQLTGQFRLPDPPEDPEDKMTSFDHLTINGNAYHLRQHLLAQQLGDPETTLVAGDRYMVVRPTRSLAGSRYPDLLVAFDADPAAYKDSNGYIIEEQGKSPDFAMEIASRSTGRTDATEKREDYAALGIGEYWRFDETGEHHGTRLAGDILVDGMYQPIALEELADGSLQGYSPVLNLYLRWDAGELLFYDPATGRPIATMEHERARADAEREARLSADAERTTEREARLAAEAERTAAESERTAEREARLAAEARVRELEEQLRRRQL